MALTWGRFKDIVESQGVDNDSILRWINISNLSTQEVLVGHDKDGRVQIADVARERESNAKSNRTSS